MIQQNRELRQMDIWSFQGGYDKNFTYILSDRASREAAVIDAAIPASQLQSITVSEGLIPLRLLVTHTHGDHIAYVREYTESFPGMDVCVFNHKRLLAEQRQISDGDIIDVGDLRISVIHTPGHYSDCVCYHVLDALFTGDTLFIGRTGRTIGTGSDTRQLYHSVYEKILTLPGDTIIYPGHDYGPVATTSLAENRKISPLLQAVNEDDFVRRMDEYEQSRLSLP